MSVKEYLKNNIVYFDGAMGTLLQQEGLQKGELPELWNLSHSEIITNIHKKYFDVGCNIVNTNTFGANILKFDEEELEQIIKSAVSCAKEAKVLSNTSQEKFISGDMGPLGRLLKPYGDLEFEEAVSVFKKSAVLFEKYGVDLITIETMNDSYETKAALLAVKESTSLPVFVSNAYSENDLLMTGATPEAVAVMLEGMGADAIGINCSYGPADLYTVLEKIVSVSSVPVIFKPNAGLPKVDKDITYFDISAEDFSDQMLVAIEKGARIVGGCCGTTPEYLSLLIEKTKDIELKVQDKKQYTIVSCGQGHVFFDDVRLIGERINPTGNKKIKEAISENNIDYILSEGIKEQDFGSHVLDVNVGVPGIDETIVLPKVISELQAIVNIPLSIDTSNIDAMEKALRIYNGKPLINSVNGKKETMDLVFPLVKKYGGVVIALTLDENGIPETSEKRVEIAKKIIECANTYGIDKKDLIFDSLTMSVSTNPKAGEITVDTVRTINEELNTKTVLGVSNISFGMPNRDEINSKFFLYAMQNGLSSAIINPYSNNIMKAYSDFTGKTDTNISFDDTIDKTMSEIDKLSVFDENEFSSKLQFSIIKGLKDRAYNLTKEMLKIRDGLEIVNEEIIPSLNIVGEGYEKKTLYLPQLLMAAEAAKSSFDAIKETLFDNKKDNSKKVVIATVHGDIHDIGKNIVKLLLENYGFNVIDLGKDVKPEIILNTVLEKEVKLVCLSALMTTTLPSMKETIELIKANTNDTYICVGGAVVTKEYAEKINADKYAKDAMETVRYAESLFSEGN